MLRSPERNNPIADPGNATTRRDVVLRQMAIHGFVSDAQARPRRSTRRSSRSSPNRPPPENPYWVEWVSRLLTNDDVARRARQPDRRARRDGRRRSRSAVARVFQSGLRIHTTLDPELQAAARSRRCATTSASRTRPPEELAREPVGAIVSIDPETGAIVAMAVGPRAYGSCAEDGSWVGTGPRGELLCDRTKVNPAVPTNPGAIGRAGGPPAGVVDEAAADRRGARGRRLAGADGRRDRPAGHRGLRQPGRAVHASTTRGGDGGHRHVRGRQAVLERLPRAADRRHRSRQARSTSPGRFGIDTHRPRRRAARSRSARVRRPRSRWRRRTRPSPTAAIHCAPFPITRIEDADGRGHLGAPARLRRRSSTPRSSTASSTSWPARSSRAAPRRSPTSDAGRRAARPAPPTATSTPGSSGYVKQLATAAWIGYDNGTLAFETEEAARAGLRSDGPARPSRAARCGSVPNRLRADARERDHRRRVPRAGVRRDHPRADVGPVHARRRSQRFEPQGFPDPGPLPTGSVPDVLRAGSVAEAERIALAAGLPAARRRGRRLPAGGHVRAAVARRRDPGPARVADHPGDLQRSGRRPRPSRSVVGHDPRRRDQRADATRATGSAGSTSRCRTRRAVGRVSASRRARGRPSSRTTPDVSVVVVEVGIESTTPDTDADDTDRSRPGGATWRWRRRRRRRRRRWRRRSGRRRRWRRRRRPRRRPAVGPGPVIGRLHASARWAPEPPRPPTPRWSSRVGTGSATVRFAGALRRPGRLRILHVADLHLAPVAGPPRPVPGVASPTSTTTWSSPPVTCSGGPTSRTLTAARAGAADLGRAARARRARLERPLRPGGQVPAGLLHRTRAAGPRPSARHRPVRRRARATRLRDRWSTRPPRWRPRPGPSPSAASTTPTSPSVAGVGPDEVLPPAAAGRPDRPRCRRCASAWCTPPTGRRSTGWSTPATTCCSPATPTADRSALPGVGALTANCDIPLDQARGASRWRGRWLHVSPGLGHSAYAPVRFACRPEATLIELTG